MQQTLAKKVSILGCGWLGLPLALKLADAGFSVVASYTNQAKLELLHKHNINSVLLNLDTPDLQNWKTLTACDVLVVAVPTSAIPILQLERLLSEADAQLKHVILISSTGIYKDTNSEITEEGETAINRGGKLFVVESLVQKFTHLNPVILRMGGLVGYDRQPAYFAKSEKVRYNPNGRINFIHRDDAVEIIQSIIRLDIRNEIFNCCTDEHPTKKEFYTQLALTSALPAPEFAKRTDDTFKIISNQKVKQALGIEFRPLYESLNGK